MTRQREDEAIFIDSSAWISYAVPTDSNNAKAIAIFTSITDHTKLYTSLFILDETITRIRKSLGQKEAYRLYLQFRKLERTKLKTLPVGRIDFDKAVLLMQKFPSPNTFSLTDATSIVLCQKHKIHTLLSFDSDFKKIKVPYLNILP